MYKKSIISAFILISLLFALVGCGNETHTHEYSGEYTYNDTHHWRFATCEHSSLTVDFEKHEYNDEFVCLKCGYEHIHDFNTDGVCVCGKRIQGSNNSAATDLVNSTFYLKSVKIECEGVLTSSYSVGSGDYTKDNYNITFVSERSGFCNFGSPIDKKIAYVLQSGLLTVKILSDDVKVNLSNSGYEYRIKEKTYPGSYSDNEIELTSSYVDSQTQNNMVKTYVFQRDFNEVLTSENYPYTYDNFVGTYTNKPEAERINYCDIIVKSGNTAEYIQHDYSSGECVTTKYVDCVAIITSEKTNGAYYYVVKAYYGLQSIDIKFNLNGEPVGFTEKV